MGYMRHHAIVVTSYSVDELYVAHKKAADIFPNVSEITGETINGYRSFFIPPDGSKEGWDTSNVGDEKRDKYIEWLNSRAFTDGSNLLGWVEVQYSDDNLETKTLRSSNDYRG